MIYFDVKYFSVVCIYYQKLDIKTTLKFLRKEVKFLSVRHNLKLNCFKISLFETHFKISNLCFFVYPTLRYGK